MALAPLLLAAATVAQASAALWTSKCDVCHTTTPSGTQLNAAGSTSTVLNYVLANQGSMAAWFDGSTTAKTLSSSDKTSIAQYIAGQTPVISLTTPFNTPRSVNVNSHITLNTVSFTSVATVSNPANGTLSSWSGTSVTYTPDAGFVGTDTFTYRGRNLGASPDLLGDARTVTIQVLPPPPPNITSSLSKSGTVGVSLSYTITATNSPTSYGATSLPGGLSRSSNVISGTPTTAGTDTATISATNAGGTDSATLTFTIAKGSQTISWAANQFTTSRPFSLNATFPILPLASVNSNLPITYTSDNTAVCTIAGETVTIKGGGTCAIRANQDGNANWNAASDVVRNVTITPVAQTITFNAQSPASRNWSSGGTFPVNPLATASSGLTPTYTAGSPSVCTVSGTTVTIVTAGNCVITANSGATASYTAATPVNQSVTINAVAPSVPQGVGGSAGPNQATVTFSPPSTNGGSAITSYTATCTASGQTTRTQTGASSPLVVTSLTNDVQYSCSVTATNASALTSAASGAVLVTPSAAPVAPVITSGASASFTVGSPGTYTLTATGIPTPTLSIVSGALPSGLTFTAGTGVVSGTPSSGTAGNHLVRFGASNSEGTAFKVVTFQVQKIPQTVTLDPLPDPSPFTNAPITLTGTASSGLPLTFDSTEPAVCTVSGDQLTFVALGTCTVVALQAGTVDIAPADSGKYSFEVIPGDQVIVFPAQPGRAYTPGGTFPIGPLASTNSGLPIAYNSLTPAVCGVAATTVTIVSTGTCTLEASQAGSDVWNPAAPATADVLIGLGSQLITFPNQSAKPFSPGGTFEINPPATASSGLAVSYFSNSPGICTVLGSTVTIVTVGSCQIRAEQGGDGNFAPAVPVTKGIAINAVVPSAPTIGVATAGNGQATIAFTPPSNDGGSPITGYQAGCVAGLQTVTATGSASPITVTGLTNNTLYTCAVRAINAVGNGALSGTVQVSPTGANGAALWIDNCSACHGDLPSGRRFNAAGTTSGVIDHAIVNQPTMAALSSLVNLPAPDRATLAEYIAGFVPVIAETTATNTPKTISVASHLTLDVISFSHAEVVTPPANGTLSAFDGTLIVYTPANGFTGTDTFTYRGRRDSPTSVVGDPRTVTIMVVAGAPIVTVTKAGTGTGRVTTLAPKVGIDCDPDCSEAYALDEELNLVAEADAGSTFAGWSGACTGTGNCVLALSASANVTATFTSSLPVFTLTVSKAGTGTGTVNSTTPPGGIACGADCDEPYTSGAVVQLAAVADSGSQFVSWSGACVGTGVCNVTMDAAKSVTATFDLAAGALSPSPASLDFGGQSMNTTAPALAVTFTNGGGSPVTVSSVTASTYFAVTHDCTTVNAGVSCTANVSFTPTAEGSLNGTLTLQSSAGPVTVPLAGTGERSLVTHYYRSILRRAPDAGGKAFWESEKVRLPALGANVNETWYAMATFFFFSAEYQSFNRDDTGFVTDLYNTFFNRGPDAGGLGFWTGQLAQGMPREVVLVSFMFSSEFQSFTQAIFGNVVARKEVDTVVDFYRGLLSRLPDDGGFASWVGQFRTAQCQGAGAVYATVESISSGFANSGEYANRNRTNAQYVGDLYNAFLRRGGDLGGVQFWINELTTGARTRAKVRQDFISSPEFTNRVNAIINEGCVP